MTSDAPLPHPDDDQAPSTVPGAGTGSDTAGTDAAARAEAARSLRMVELAREIERHVADLGWDQNPRLFALARTRELLALEPELAPALAEAAQDPTSLTPIEQEQIDHGRPLDEVLATTAWPDEVQGAALVLERVMLPPEAEESLPEDQAELEAAAATHPQREDVRMAVVVTRDGASMCAVRMRSHDVDDEVLVGETLVPRLVQALAATLR